MTYTQSYSSSSTFTESRARFVMDKFLDDILGLHGRGFITQEKALKWYRDVLYVLSKESADYFEVQFSSSANSECGLRYQISDDGYIYEDSESGGIDFYSLPNNIQASLFLSLRTNSKKYDEVLTELKERGWGTNGKSLEGNSVRDRAYSKSGYGLVRNKVGNW